MKTKSESSDIEKLARHEYYLKRRKAALAYQREYDKAHREQRRAYLKEYREKKKKVPPEE